MKSAFIKLFIPVVFLAITGCAPVKFYSNPEMTRKSGLKYYTVKPFLLVERDPASNNVLKATVLYLPDLENPEYMVIKDGLGSRKVDLKLADGSINTFSVASDAKIPESIEALATLVAKATTAIADLSALKGIPQYVAVNLVIELYEVIMNSGVTSLKKVEIK